MSFRRFMSRGQLRMNQGTTARDHLANERTFLSWVRTSLAFVGLGVLTAELVETEGATAEFLGLALIFLGGVAAVASTARYLRVTLQLDEDRYQSSTIGPIIVGIVTLAVAITGLFFVVT